MLNLCGFFLLDAPPNSGRASNSSHDDGAFEFASEQRIQALVTRSCLAYLLEIARTRGVRRWLKVDPKVLVPDELYVTPRDLLQLYSRSTATTLEADAGGKVGVSSKEEYEGPESFMALVYPLFEHQSMKELGCESAVAE